MRNSSTTAAKVRITEDYVQWRNAQSAVEWTQKREITRRQTGKPGTNLLFLVWFDYPGLSLSKIEVCLQTRLDYSEQYM